MLEKRMNEILKYLFVKSCGFHFSLYVFTSTFFYTISAEFLIFNLNFQIHGVMSATKLL